MSTFAKNTRASLIPCLRYRDPTAAITWLCQAFGFQAHLVVPDEQGAVVHAELSCGTGMLMIGPAANQDDAYSRLLRQPQEIGGNTQTLYMVVADTDAVYAQAQACGAHIVMPIKDEDYGGRGFTCRDLEGHVWSFGSYDPWNPPAV